MDKTQKAHRAHHDMNRLRPGEDRSWRVGANEYDYLKELLEGPFAVDRIKSRINEFAALIRPYVAADDNKFYTTEQFEQCLEEDITEGGRMGMHYQLGLKTFIEERSKSVREQLAGIRKSGPGDGSGNGGSFRMGPPPSW